MTASSFLEQARDLELDVRFIDALLSRAVADSTTHPKVIARLLQRRSASVHAWGQMWQTKSVAE